MPQTAHRTQGTARDGRPHRTFRVRKPKRRHGYQKKRWTAKVWVTDFFFTTCPTICPKMKNEMLRVLDAYQGDERVVILSHSIDPEHDTQQVLKNLPIACK